MPGLAISSPQIKRGTSNLPLLLDETPRSNHIFVDLHDVPAPCLYDSRCFNFMTIKQQAQAAPPHGGFSLTQPQETTSTWFFSHNGLLWSSQTSKLNRLRLACWVQHEQRRISSAPPTQRQSLTSKEQHQDQVRIEQRYSTYIGITLREESCPSTLHLLISFHNKSNFPPGKENTVLPTFQNERDIFT